ncbi:hypothetical protein ACFSKM_27765 [Ancylobacter dichloromethanicus]|uniref:Uncharacterized protein n=1 Tax=Ancylobacter dichloromethanicus TaxID=518825 RepID=A0A9W6JEA3_9HYPH|nr:hypothetical protein GCM10017643_48370 [Ancylobacter dichloromethanicus]
MTTKPADPSSWCQTNAPWTVSTAELAVMSPDNKAKLVTHNEYGEAHCGWKPAGGA